MIESETKRQPNLTLLEALVHKALKQLRVQKLRHERVAAQIEIGDEILLLEFFRDGVVGRLEEFLIVFEQPREKAEKALFEFRVRHSLIGAQRHFRIVDQFAQLLAESAGKTIRRE